jgi:phage tail sheath protein FI
MTPSDKDIQYWKDRFARERAEQAASEKLAIEDIRDEFDKKLVILREENEKLRVAQAPQQEESSGFLPFAVGCLIGLIIGG